MEIRIDELHKLPNQVLFSIIMSVDTPVLDIVAQAKSNKVRNLAIATKKLRDCNCAADCAKHIAANYIISDILFPTN